jgi:hypothetical protein
MITASRSYCGGLSIEQLGAGCAFRMGAGFIVSPA